MSLLQTPFSALFLQTAFSDAPSAGPASGNNNPHDLRGYWFDLSTPSACATESATALDDTDAFSTDFGLSPAKARPLSSNDVFEALNSGAPLPSNTHTHEMSDSSGQTGWIVSVDPCDSFWAAEAADEEEPDQRGFTGPIHFTVEAHRGASVVHASYARSPSSTPIPLLIKRSRSDEEAADRPSSKRQRGASTPPVQPCKFEGSSARTPPPPSSTPRAGSAFSAFQKRLSSSEGPQALACAERRTSW
mmetsp:Transcript_5986/g.15216  ORF Transcript_5986/g.15216 Transcript_5986/m.15216 type:complete len:247 (-) Transcript_5986:139-879(-)